MVLFQANSMRGWKYLNTYSLTDHTTTINLSSVDFDEICIFVKVGTLNAYNQYIVPKAVFSLKDGSYIRSGNDTYNTTFSVQSALTLTNFYVTYAGTDKTSDSEAIIYYK